MKTFTLKYSPVLACFILFISAFTLYFNAIGNKYCLDDAIVITRNEFTKQGISGIPDIFTTESFTGFFGKKKDLVSGSRYRPLSIASFAIEYEIFKKPTPAFSHLFNIILYGFTGIFIFLLLSKVLKDPGMKHVPFLTALIFIFHPIHTEVVTNIKGRDELMALFFSLAACLVMLEYVKNRKRSILIAAAFLWLLGLFSKENAIIFGVLMPLILYISGIRKTKDLFDTVLAFSVPAIIFLVIRHLVIGSTGTISGELMNNSFADADATQKYATIFLTFWKYILLLIFPLTLTYDYYPYHIQLVGWTNYQTVLGVFLFAGSGIWLIWSLRNNKLVALALSIYLLALLPVSNILFPIGTFMSERFLYFSSVGFCLLVAFGLMMFINKFPGTRIAVFVFAGMIFILYSIRTISRNNDWYDDYTLFTTDVRTSFNSAKSNCSAGGILLESLDSIQNADRKSVVLEQSIQYLKKAVAIHTAYDDAVLLLGNAYFIKQRTDSAKMCYTTILSRNPGHDLAYRNMQALVNRENATDVKINLLKTMLKYKPMDYRTLYQLGTLYGKQKNDLEGCIRYLKKALEISPGAKEVYVDLGVAYGLLRDYKNSAVMLQKASEIDPSDANIFINLGITWQNLQQAGKAAECFEKARELQKNRSTDQF